MPMKLQEVVTISPEGAVSMLKIVCRCGSLLLKIVNNPVKQMRFLLNDNNYHPYPFDSKIRANGAIDMTNK